MDFSEQEPEAIVNLVLTQLQQGDFQQRWEISKILPDLGADVLEPLLNILQDETADLEMRWFVARILGQFKSEVVIEPLINLLKTSQPEATEDELSLQEMIAISLASLGTSAIVPLTQLLTQEECKRLAIVALAQIPHSETITPLLTVVHDSNPEIRAIAIEALGSFPDHRVIPVLLDALNDPVANVRKEAVIGLGLRLDLLGNINLVEKLKPLLWDIRPEVCQQAQLALARLKTDEAATALFEQVQSPSVPLSLKLEGVRCLGWIETSKSLSYLQEILVNFNSELNFNQSSLSEIDLALIQEIIQGIGRVETIELREQATPIIVDLLRDNSSVISNYKIKQLMALQLGKLGLISAVDPLIQLLADPHPSVRFHCISALKQIECQETYQYLQDFLNQDHINPDLKQGILKALSEW